MLNTIEALLLRVLKASFASLNLGKEFIPQCSLAVDATEDEDPYRRDGPSPARSKVKIAMSRGASWPISLERKRRKVPETSK